MKKFLINLEGIAAAEFALMAPFLLFMLIGMFDYGIFMNTAMKMENTAMAAAQYIVQGGDEENLTADVFGLSGLGLTEDNVEVAHFYECEDSSAVEEGSYCGTGDYLRDYVQVTVSLEYETLIPFPGIWDSINLEESVRLQYR